MALYTDISIDQGSTYTGRIPVVNSDGRAVDLTSFQARGQIRKTYASTSAIDFDIIIDDPTSGVVNIGLTPDVTQTLKPGRYVFDVEIFDSTDVIRVSEGQVHVSPRVTRHE
jgi:hypothetical protein